MKDDVEEEINVEFLAQLIAADEATERRDRRQQLFKETKAEDSEEHLMRDFAKAKPSERQVLWAKIKKEQADLIAEAREQYRTSKSSGSKDSAEGDLRRTGDTSIATIWQRVRPIYTGARGSTDAVRPPTPPPPPHAGLKPKGRLEGAFRKQ